jgi:ABC-type transport system involved in multi-copper enzyme maturation permease subunit
MKVTDTFKAEFTIYKKSVLTKALWLITFLMAVIFGFIIFHSSSFSGPLSFLALMKGYENGFNFSLSLISSTYNIIVFLIIILASTAISDEAQKGTLKTILVNRVKRREFIVGKAFFLLAFFMALLGVISILSLAAGGILFGLSDISEKSYIIHTQLDLFLNYFLSLFFTAFSVFALINLCLFFSVLFNNSLLCFLSSLGVNFIFYIFTELDFHKYFFLTSYLSFPLKNVQKMAQGLPLIWSPKLEYMLISTLLYALGFLLLAIACFNKKEIV